VPNAGGATLTAEHKATVPNVGGVTLTVERKATVPNAGGATLTAERKATVPNAGGVTRTAERKATVLNAGGATRTAERKATVPTDICSQASIETSSTLLFLISGRNEVMKSRLKSGNACCVSVRNFTLFLFTF